MAVDNGVDVDRESAIGLAYLQMHDETLRIDFGLFHKCVEIACGRGVMTHEFGKSLGYESLKVEVSKAWEKMIKEREHHG